MAVRNIVYTIAPSFATTLQPTSPYTPTHQALTLPPFSPGPDFPERAASTQERSKSHDTDTAEQLEQVPAGVVHKEQTLECN